MATIGKALSAVLGMAGMHGAYVMLQSPISSAAWGWQWTPEATEKFTCAEGATVGCPGYGQPGYEGCAEDNSTCTVQAKEGQTCSPSTIQITCFKHAAPASKFDPISGACINVGMPSMNMTLDSTLDIPEVTCTPADGMTCNDVKEMYKDNECCGSPEKPLGDTDMLRLRRMSSAASKDDLLKDIRSALQHAKSEGGEAKADLLKKKIDDLIFEHADV